jgi:hypothetical protein
MARWLSVCLIHLSAAANVLDMSWGDVGTVSSALTPRRKHGLELVQSSGHNSKARHFHGQGIVRQEDKRRKVVFPLRLSASLNGILCCAYKDIWSGQHEDQSRYDYICTHSDDFTFAAKGPACWMSITKSSRDCESRQLTRGGRDIRIKPRPTQTTRLRQVDWRSRQTGISQGSYALQDLMSGSYDATHGARIMRLRGAPPHQGTGD